MRTLRGAAVSLVSLINIKAQRSGYGAQSHVNCGRTCARRRQVVGVEGVSPTCSSLSREATPAH